MNQMTSPGGEPSAATHISPVPRIAIQAFCETGDVARVVETATGDRRMDKAHVKVQMGGAPAAAEVYRTAPTPNVIVLEFTAGDSNALLGALDDLAESCDPGTKVVVIGHVNRVCLSHWFVERVFEHIQLYHCVGLGHAHTDRFIGAHRLGIGLGDPERHSELIRLTERIHISLGHRFCVFFD
jgi:hypothetical protein